MSEARPEAEEERQWTSKGRGDGQAGRKAEGAVEGL